MEKYYSVKQVAETVNVHTNTVYAWIKKGWLKAQRIGKIFRIYESDLQEFLNRWN